MLFRSRPWLHQRLRQMQQQEFWSQECQHWFCKWIWADWRYMEPWFWHLLASSVKLWFSLLQIHASLSMSKTFQTINSLPKPSKKSGRQQRAWATCMGISVILQWECHGCQKSWSGCILQQVLQTLARESGSYTRKTARVFLQNISKACR